MCSYIVETVGIRGSAKGPSGWMSLHQANVYFDHPYHATLDHALGIDFLNEAGERVAVELSAESARALVDKILAALADGEIAHAATPHLEHAHLHAQSAEAADLGRKSRVETAGPPSC